MSTVTVFTAERMQEIENNAIVSGTVVGDDLILTTFDNTDINAGNVRGATGATGAAGEVTTAELEAYLPKYDDPADLLADSTSIAALILLNSTYGYVLARKQVGVWVATLGPVAFTDTADETGVVYLTASTFGFVSIISAQADANWGSSFDSLQIAQAKVVTGDIQIRGFFVNEDQTDSAIAPAASITVAGSVIMTGKWE